MQVRRRLVIYVQGYDPRGLAEYYRLFRREYRETCALYGLTGKVGKPSNDADRFITRWSAETRGDNWQVDTQYLFLRWEDIIRTDFARPVWWKIAQMLRAMVSMTASGVLFRMLRAHWRFGLFVLYPLVLTALWLVFGGLAGYAVAAALEALGLSEVLAGLLGAAAGAGAVAGALWLTEGQTYLLYLCDDGASTFQFAHGERPDWEARLDAFAGHVVEAVQQSNADEVVIVGHSSGSFLAVDVVDRALTRDPALGRHGPRVRLLTLGANLPIVGFHRRATWFRDKLARLAVAADIDWVDYQSRHDVMNFWPFDPVADHGVAVPGRHNPTVVSISLRDLWIPGNFGRRRWRFFQAHFQFLLSNERAGAAYDYYLICCGPYDLVSRATRPDAVRETPPATAVELPAAGPLV